MRSRVITALIGGPAFLAAAILGDPWWSGVVTVIALLGLLEWKNLSQALLGVPVAKDALLGGGLAILAGAYNAAKGPAGAALGVGAWFLAAGLYALFREAFSSRRPMAGGGSVVLGLLYVPGLLSHLILLRSVEPGGLSLTLLAVLGTWATDTGAFFTGRLLGGRRLAPGLSPAKTVSGAVGGWVSGFVAVLLAGVFAAALPLSRAAALAALVPLAAQLGDLLESAFKREAGVKDAGGLLPGHGGILDRFDSLLVVAPTVYYFFLLV
ncbi:MAG: phosphatidate cytidylyltransferase [Firmicutes bacterium]|nr:phosphatidate cytidylyltransferase [Bacillota bacterium]